ncbi:MAG: hypothetical protein OIF57_12575 [Marinobacterium sp.]|nr:hypothetical protein [Marinobacterium sp.]
MSEMLTQILDRVREEYLQVMEETSGHKPYAMAEKLCHERLFIETDTLAKIIEQDPSLLAARAGSLIMNAEEAANPAVGVIVSSNVIAAAMEGLLSLAVEHNWLDVDAEGAILVDEAEMQCEEYPINADYSHSETARNNLALPGQSGLSTIFNTAEKAFAEALQQCSRDAYQKALEMSSDYAVFAPDDLAPLVAENPLLLGLREDDLIDADIFEGDPPAGLIISTHLTRMLLHQLLELAVSEGVLALDAQGHILVQEEERAPTLH